jgi:hypothetical protein
MGKFTFRLKDRMKLTVEKVSPRVCLFIVSGKHTHTFRITSKRAKELVKVFTDVSTFGYEDMRVDLTGSDDTKNGVLHFGDMQNGDYHLLVFSDTKKILDTTFNKKFLKKMYRTMKEVYEIE